MKRLTMIIAIAAAAFGIAGCGGNSDGWYPFQGGYVNLRNVKTITTHAKLFATKNDGYGDLVMDDAITRESIKTAKEKIRKEYKDSLSHIRSEAYIAFDGAKVELQGLKEFKSYKEVLSLLDSWLEAVESLELPTK